MTRPRVTIANRGNARFEVDPKRPLLDELRAQGVDLPYGCEYGGCITCAAKLTRGEVDQRRQTALNNRQLSHGYVLLCVARPLGDVTLEVGVESHDRLYRNPFLDPLEPHELKADIATPKPSSSEAIGPNQPSSSEAIGQDKSPQVAKRRAHKKTSDTEATGQTHPQETRNA